MKVLVIEDDSETAAFIARGLSEHGHVVDVASDGRDGLLQASGSEYDMLIIDRMLPGMDGLAIVRTLRAAATNTPVLFLTAIAGVDDRVQGLDVGADDYLVKPFAFAELNARVSALGRRPAATEATTSLQVGDLAMNLLTRRVARAGQELDLQPQEFRLLEFLMRHADRVVTRTMLLEGVWGFHFDPRTSVVETHISRLRAKIDRGYPQPLIHTVRGSGYSLHASS